MTRTKVDQLEPLGKVLREQQSDALRELLSSALARVMDWEANQACNASYGERSEERLNSRNGYRARELETRLGTLRLGIPKLRQGSYMPSFLEPRRRWERAFVNVVSEAYVLGVSTRKVEELVESMGARGMSKSEVSRMAAELDTQVNEFRRQPLEKEYPYMYLDALYVKVREGGRVVSKAALVAYGVAETGEREVLGVDVAAGEMESAWKSFLESLVSRGLRGVELVISDNHSGLRKAIRAVMNGSSWQRCTVHFMRNVLARVPRTAQGMVSALVRTVFQQPSYEEARAAMGKALATLEPKYPEAAEVVREAEDDVLSHMSFPSAHWRQIRSTNPLERLNKEIRRRTDVVGIFPNAASSLRLIAMVLVEQNDEWAVGRRYFSLESMAQLRGVQQGALEEAK